jgi:hypothetical protein
MKGTVTAELELWCVEPRQTMPPMLASLSYSREDPYAVRLAFYVGLDKPIEWTFARDLLSDGLAGREGIGDVRLWPSMGSASGTPGSVVNIELRSPFGKARFEAPAKEISDFIYRTRQIVPAGAESQHLDFDSELADVLCQEC